MRKNHTYGENMLEYEHQQDERHWNRQMARAIRDNDEQEVAELINEGNMYEYQLRCAVDCIRSEKISAMIEEYAYN